MLTRLSVTNFAIIDELQLQFEDGLTIITGETGAGKSILLGALKLVLGERADLKQLKNTEKKCIIEATFNLEKLALQHFFAENDLDFEAETILRRELLPSGKSRAFINDTPVTLDVLQQLSNQLIDIHGQFNTQNLLEEKYQLHILDAVANQLDFVENYQHNFQVYLNSKQKLKDLEHKLHTQALEAEYKTFLLNELVESNLQPNEIEELEKIQNELQNVDEIQQTLSEVDAKLDNEFGANVLLNDIANQLNKIAQYSSEFEELAERVNSVKFELKDIHLEIVSKISRLESDPQRLTEVTERLNHVHTLLQKHRLNSVHQLIELQEQLQNETADFNQIETEIESVKAEISKQEKQLEDSAKVISENREKVIETVKTSILNSLAQLGMENSNLEIELQKLDKLTSTGRDQIQMLFSANKGMALQTIGKSVSGGERSRLMLAVKNLLSTHLQLPTLILDEVDTGVSGKVADEVGKLMQNMANGMQVISITHLPQVAAKGKQHLKVQKKTQNEITTTEVLTLNPEQRIVEIAELISGSTISETAIQQAKELLQK